MLSQSQVRSLPTVDHATPMTPDADSLLLVLPVPFRRRADGQLLFEKQACNGLDRWADHFRRLVVAGPLKPERLGEQEASTVEYQPVNDIPTANRISFVPLPWAFTVRHFVRHYRQTRAILASLIQRCEYLQFAIGGLIGDWAAVAANEAIAQGRPYAIWTDRVEHQVIRADYLNHRGLKRLYRRTRDNWLYSPLMKCLEQRLIVHADVGLFHGRDCYEAYAPHCRSPQLVHNIHMKASDRINPQLLRNKLDHVHSGEPLRLLYAGRTDWTKGPLDWLHTLLELRRRGVPFHATWLGDGPMLPELRAALVAQDLEAVVDLPGYISDRQIFLHAMHHTDLFVFCHKTRESPRCLIEALMSGTPIIGYDSHYPRDLLEGLGDQLLTPPDEPVHLADRIATFDRDRRSLTDLVSHCAELGSKYSDHEVFRHRSELIRQHLTRSESPSVKVI